MRIILALLLAFTAAAQIPGTFRVTGPVAPPATNSNFGAALPVYNYGGLLTGLSSLSQLQDTNRYPVARRHAGQIAILTNGAQYVLGTNLLSWHNTGSVSNLAALRQIEPAAVGGVVTVDNYDTVADLGGGSYMLVSTITGTNALGGKVLALGGSLSWELQTQGTISVKQFGSNPTNYFGYTINALGGDVTLGASTSSINIPGRIVGTEIADPAAPSANQGTLYFRDNGAGKTELVVRFNTGAIQVIATEP